MLTIAVASVKHSCESILKRFVSEYENHFDERCNVDETTANEEFAIAVNGPNLANNDSVIFRTWTCTGKESHGTSLGHPPWRNSFISAVFHLHLSV